MHAMFLFVTFGSSAEFWGGQSICGTKIWFPFTGQELQSVLISHFLIFIFCRPIKIRISEHITARFDVAAHDMADFMSKIKRLTWWSIINRSKNNHRTVAFVICHPGEFLGCRRQRRKMKNGDAMCPTGFQ